MKAWIELVIQNEKREEQSKVYFQLRYEGYCIRKDGGISNWLDTDFEMKGWRIVAVGIMTGYIAVQIIPEKEVEKVE